MKQSNHILFCILTRLNTLKSFFTIFCFHLLLLYGQQDDQLDPQTILDSPVIISLERIIERYEETSRLMQQAGFTNIQRFNAIDGWFTDEDFFHKLNIHKDLNPGRKGCAASHLLLWEKFAKDTSEKEFLFICEDDMLPHSNFPILFPLFWKAAPKDFDIFMVGCLNFIAEDQKDKLINNSPSATTHAYIISKKGAKKLLDFYNALTKDFQTDNFIIDLFIMELMTKQKIIYYCCNGINFPDFLNRKKIVMDRAVGICFQNCTFASTIFPEIPLPQFSEKDFFSNSSCLNLSNIKSEIFEEFLINFLKNKKVAYCPNIGNAGDALIWYGTMCFFKKLGISYIPYNLAMKYGLLPDMDVIVYGGGGNFVPYYHNCSTFLEENMGSSKPILLLPHTIQGYENLLEHLLPNVMIFCREQMSYDHCKSFVPFKENVILAHDLAFFADLSFAELKEENNPPKNLFAFRTDIEIHPLRKNMILPSSNQDISQCGWISEASSYDANYAVVEKFINTINDYDIVWTDRLHVAIAAFLLGKKVHLFDNSYGKNRAVFDHSIKHLDKCKRVVFHENWDIDFLSLN